MSIYVSRKILSKQIVNMVRSDKTFAQRKCTAECVKLTGSCSEASGKESGCGGSTGFLFVAQR